MTIPSIRSAVLLVGLLAAAAAAQVDNRVQPLQPVPGRARDANNMVGSGGFNTPSNAGAFINSANAVMSGNVYGLGGFHYTNSSPLGFGSSFGSLGAGSSLFSTGVRNSFNTTGLAGFNAASISNPYLFQASLPSADISYFNRQGFSIGDARSLPSGGPRNIIPNSYQPYYAQSNTVLNTGAIQSGLNRPGTSGLDSPFTPLFQGSLSTFGSVPQTLPDGVPDPLDRRLAPNALNQPVSSFGLMSVVGGAAADVPDWQRPYIGATQSPLFGPSGFDARISPAFADNLFAARAGQANLGDAERIAAAERAQTPAPGEAAGERLAGAQPATLSPQPLSESLVGIPPTGPTAMALKPEQLGVDRFFDMAMAVREAAATSPDYLAELTLGRAAPADAAGATPGGAAGLAPPTAPIGQVGVPGGPADATGQPAEAQESGRTPRDPRDPRAVMELRFERAAKWAQEMLRTPMKTFVGRGEDAVNRHLAAAEAALRSGEYYTAAGEYGLASNLAPNNPLPLLGRGHALAAAGDYVSAVLFLTRGISRFPDVVAFDFDLPALIGGQDVFDVRRADLEKQLSRVDSYELRFLLGYLEYYSGLREAGLKNLRAAAAKAPADSLIARFPELLTGQSAAPKG